MPEFEERIVCRAPAEEVWKLLYDPARFPEWLDGYDRVEVGDDRRITRFDRRWPDFAYVADVRSRREDARVVISCLISDIVHEWTLEPAPEGCSVRLRVQIPEDEAARLEDNRAAMRSSMARLAAAAERA